MRPGNAYDLAGKLPGLGRYRTWSVGVDSMNRDVESYFSAVPGDRRSKIDALHGLIMDLFPRAVVDMTYKMPTYRYREGWVAIANQKNYISLYTCGYHHIEKFKKKNPGIKTGKGCINFRARDEIHYGDLEAVIRHAIDHPKS